MTAPDIEALVERLEKCSGPDRELDADIAVALRIYNGPHEWARHWSGEWRAIEGTVHLLGTGGERANFRPPRFTESVDAAMSLVPADAGFEIKQNGSPCYASVFTKLYEYMADAATPAAALSCAALRARAQADEDER